MKQILLLQIKLGEENILHRFFGVSHHYRGDVFCDRVVRPPVS